MFLLLTITPLLGRQNNNEAFLVLKNKKKQLKEKEEENRRIQELYPKSKLLLQLTNVVTDFSPKF